MSRKKLKSELVTAGVDRQDIITALAQGVQDAHGVPDLDIPVLTQDKELRKTVGRLIVESTFKVVWSGKLPGQGDDHFELRTPQRPFTMLDTIWQRVQLIHLRILATETEIEAFHRRGLSYENVISLRNPRETSAPRVVIYSEDKQRAITLDCMICPIDLSEKYHVLFRKESL